MSAAGYGVLSAVVLVAGVATFGVVQREANYKPTDATVFRIDRTCGFTRITEGQATKKSEQVTQDCSATEEFRQIAGQVERNKDVDGHAVVKVSYIAPQDHAYHTGEFKLSGYDDRFYKLKAGDKLKVLVANKNLDKIRLD